MEDYIIRHCRLKIISTKFTFRSQRLKVVVFFSSHNLNNKFFSKIKDPVFPPPHTLQSFGLVYDIKCTNCDNHYIGETKQLLDTRMKQHRNDVPKKKKTTTLCEHATTKGHNFEFDQPYILWYEGNYRKRKYHEAIDIIKQEKYINFKTDIKDVSDTFFIDYAICEMINLIQFFVLYFAQFCNST